MRWPCGGVAWRGVGIRVNLLEEAGGKWLGRSKNCFFEKRRNSASRKLVRRRAD
jgi:hypothetical protein